MYFAGQYSQAQRTPDPDNTMTLLLKTAWPSNRDVKFLLRLYKVVAARESYEACSEAIWLSTEDTGRWIPTTGQTLSQNLGRAVEVIKEEPASGLLICGCAAWSNVVGRMFDARLALLGPYGSTLRRSLENNHYFAGDTAAAIVRIILSCAIELLWNLDEKELTFVRMMEFDPTLASDLCAALPANLACLRRDIRDLDSLERFKRIAKDRSIPGIGALSHLPETLDGEFAISVRWRLDAPIYVGGMHFFTFQPFDQRPTLESLQLLIAKAHAPDEGRKVFFVASSPQVLRRLRDEFEQVGIDQPTDWNIRAQIYRLILAVSRLLFLDTLEFLDQALRESKRVVCFNDTTNHSLQSN